MQAGLELIERMRASARSALPKKAFLRRDRGDGLFISNAPAFEPGLKEINGFDVACLGGLIRLYPGIGWLKALEEACPLPEDDFSRSMLRFRGMEIGKDAVILFCEGCKLLEAGDTALEGEIARYDRNARQMAARALREGGGGGLYALSLLDAWLKK